MPHASSPGSRSCCPSDPTPRPSRPSRASRGSICRFLPVEEAAAQAIAARVGFIDTPELLGIAYVTGFRQDMFPFVRDDFLYTFQGLSADGQWYVAVNWVVRATMFPRRVSQADARRVGSERHHMGAIHRGERGHPRCGRGDRLPPVARDPGRAGPVHRLRQRRRTEPVALGRATGQRRPASAAPACPHQAQCRSFGGPRSPVASAAP